MPASGQVMISTPNFYRLEIAYSELPYYNATHTPPPDVPNCFCDVPDSPGINSDYVAAGPDRSLID